MANFPDPLRILDLAQTRAASVLASVNHDQLDLPTPCDEWSVRDVMNKLVASTLLFASFGRREDGDPNLDLINPKDLIGDDPLGVYISAALECREAWRSPALLTEWQPQPLEKRKHALCLTQEYLIRLF